MHPNTRNGEIKQQISTYLPQTHKEKVIHTLILFLVDDRTVMLCYGLFCFLLVIGCVTVIQMTHLASQLYKLG